MAIDFQPIDQSSNIDFQPMEQPLPDGSFLQNASQKVGKALAFVDNPGYAIRGEMPPQVNDLDAESPLTTIGNAFDKGGQWLAGKLGEKFPNHPYLNATAAMAGATLANPLTTAGPEAPDAILPSTGLSPKVAAQREARTGVPARDFQRLYNDPGARVASGDVKQAGADIGSAKAYSGINQGVTNDLSSLTPENIDRINPTKATKLDDINAVVSKLNDPHQSLPIVPPGSQTGEPHALFAYNDNFGPEGTSRPVYNVFGDRNDPKIQQAGWGSSVPKERLEELGIPVTGRQPNALRVTPQEAQNGLDSINSILSQPSVQNNSDVLRQWSAIKTHLNNALQDVAPDVRQANQQYARLKLRDTFQNLEPLNKNGKISKLGMMAQGASAGVGALLGHLIPGLNSLEGAIAGSQVGKYLNMAYHSPYVAGLQTAIGSYLDKAGNPILSGAANAASGASPLAAYLANYQNRAKSESGR